MRKKVIRLKLLHFLEVRKTAQAQEVKVERIPWILIIPISIFLGFFGTVWYGFIPSPYFATNSLGIVLCGPEFIGTPFFILIVFAALQALAAKTGLLKQKASPATLTYLYVTGMGIGYLIVA